MNQLPELWFEGAARGVAVLGAAGYVGGKLIERLVANRGPIETILAIDVRAAPPEGHGNGVVFEQLDLRSAELSELFRAHRVDCVVHLVSMVAPPLELSTHDQYSIDVDGTHNVVEACLTADVSQVIVMSGAAAYGYHADLAVPITEDAPLRGNDEFPHARHKRLVEAFLARYRAAHPELAQLIFRPGAILGERTSNALTDFFLRPVIVGISGARSPFAFILDDDVADCIVKGIHERRTGTFNLAGDGAITLREIARATGARYVELPADVLRAGLGIMRACSLTNYGAEQVAFLQHRPQLSNEALKRDYGFTPTRTSREVFDLWWAARQGQRSRPVVR